MTEKWCHNTTLRGETFARRNFLVFAGFFGHFCETKSPRRGLTCWVAKVYEWTEVQIFGEIYGQNFNKQRKNQHKSLSHSKRFSWPFTKVNPWNFAFYFSRESFSPWSNTLKEEIFAKEIIAELKLRINGLKIRELRNLKLRICQSFLKMLNERLKIKAVKVLFATTASHFLVLLCLTSREKRENIVCFASLNIIY